jgi:IclR family acetate operon transcriptional repressor
LARIRELGYSVDNQEYFEGVRCLAAPVFSANGKVTAAIGITGSTARFSESDIPGVAEKVMRAARELSPRLGHTVAPSQPPFPDAAVRRSAS